MKNPERIIMRDFQGVDINSNLFGVPLEFLGAFWRRD
jgi:hypothetical protein